MAPLIWLGSFGWYLLSCSPSLGAEDSGEFTAVAATLGLSHAPGYPLFALAGRLMCALPVGSVAFRLNLLSASAAACAVAGVHGFVRTLAEQSFGLRRGRAAVCAGAAAVLLGWSHALWSQAVISDKYAVHLAFFAAVLRLAVCSGRAPALAFGLGLGFAHHLQMLYVVPALVWQVQRAARRPPGPLVARATLLAGALFLLALSPKLVYPPVRSAPGASGQPLRAGPEAPLALAAPRHAAALVRYLRAAPYTSRIRGPAWARWRSTGQALVGQLGWMGCALGLAGLLALMRLAPGPGIVLGLTAATGLGLTASLDITGREFYLLPVVWVLAAAIGGLLAAAMTRGAGAGGDAAWRGPVWIGLAAVIVALTEVPENLSLRHRAGVTLEYDTGRDLLSSLPLRAAIFVGEDDFIYPLFHLQLVEGWRPDVLVIPQGALTSPAWRDRLARRAPELAEALTRPLGIEDEDAWSRVAISALLGAGRACLLTNPAREGVWRGRRLACRELAYEVFQGAPRVPVRRAAGLRARGWYTPPAALTERERWLLAIYADRQRDYAGLLAATGRPEPARDRFKRATTNPFLGRRAEAERALARLSSGPAGAAP